MTKRLADAIHKASNNNRHKNTDKKRKQEGQKAEKERKNVGPLKVIPITRKKRLKDVKHLEEAPNLFFPKGGSRPRAGNPKRRRAPNNGDPKQREERNDEIPKPDDC